MAWTIKPKYKTRSQKSHNSKHTLNYTIEKRPKQHQTNNNNNTYRHQTNLDPTTHHKLPTPNDKSMMRAQTQSSWTIPKLFPGTTAPNKLTIEQTNENPNPTFKKLEHQDNTTKINRFYKVRENIITRWHYTNKP